MADTSGPGQGAGSNGPGPGQIPSKNPASTGNLSGGTSNVDWDKLIGPEFDAVVIKRAKKAWGEASEAVADLILPAGYKRKVEAVEADIAKSRMAGAKKVSDATMMYLRNIQTAERANFEKKKAQMKEIEDKMRQAGATEAQISRVRAVHDEKLKKSKMAAEASESPVAGVLQKAQKASMVSVGIEAARGLGEALGGPAGAEIGGILGLILAKTIGAAINTLPINTQTGAALNSSHMKGKSPLDLFQQVFPKELGQVDYSKAQDLIKTLIDSPKSLQGDVAGNFKELFGVLGNNIPDVSEITRIYATASLQSNASTKDLVKAMVQADKVALSLGMSTQALFREQLRLREIMINLTSNGDSANEVLARTADAFKGLGATRDIVKNFAENMAGFTSGMGIEKFTQMFALVNGGKIATDTDYSSFQKDPQTFIQQLFKKVQGMAPDDQRKDLYSAKIAEFLGLQGMGGGKMLEAFERYMSGTASAVDKATVEKAIRGGTLDMGKGAETLRNSVSLGEQIANFMSNFMMQFGTPLLGGVNIVSQYVAKLPASPWDLFKRDHMGPAIAHDHPQSMNIPNKPGTGTPVVSSKTSESFTVHKS